MRHGTTTGVAPVLISANLVMVLAAAWAGGVVGLVCCVFAVVRGRPDLNRPVCRRCGVDLREALAIQSEGCPGCSAALTPNPAAGARLRRRRPAWPVLTIGLLIGLSAGTPAFLGTQAELERQAAVAAAVQARRIADNPFADHDTPSFVALAATSTGRRPIYLRQVVVRMQEGRLPDEALQRICTALHAQGLLPEATDASRGGDPDAILNRHLAGRLESAARRPGASPALQDAIGDLLAPRWTVKAAADSPGVVVVRARYRGLADRTAALRSATIVGPDGRAHPLVPQRDQDRDSAVFALDTVPLDVPGDLAPGRYEVRIVLETACLFPDNLKSRALSRAAPPEYWPEAGWRRTRTLRRAYVVESPSPVDSTASEGGGR